MTSESIAFTDTHVHFWDMREPALRYEWLEQDWIHPVLGDHGAIKSLRYWPDDFVAETRFSNVGAAIHVQAAIGSPDPVEETAWLQRFSDRRGVPTGIVAYVDLADDAAGDTLDRHSRFSSLCGIRDLRYDDYLTDRRWQRGYAQLESRNLVLCDDPLLDAMDDVAALASLYEGITYCVDHAGWPRSRDAAYFQEWKTKMRNIAVQPNTVVKISGLGMSDPQWTLDSLRPWVLVCIEMWGTERAFFGSNWPVDRLFSSYTDLLNAYREIIKDFTLAEQTALLGTNATRIFGLD